METITIPLPIFRTVTVVGYFERINYYVGVSGFNHAEAWRSVEEEAQEYGIPERYSSYQSFQRSKYYHYEHRNDLVRINTDAK